MQALLSEPELLGANNASKKRCIGAKNFQISLKIGASYTIIHLLYSWGFIYGTNCIAKTDRLE